MLLWLRAVLLTSVGKKIVLFLAHEKGLGHMLKNSLVVPQFSFFASPQAENNFWLDRP